MALTFHRLVQDDLRIVLRYYEEEGGQFLADRFFDELEQIIAKVAQHPTKFHLIDDEIRRANLRNFPYHILFRQLGDDVRVLILRHHKRRPNLGLRRQ
jgi:plasmid stabilization system protein ParE